jgi:hypothetical protein
MELLAPDDRAILRFRRQADWYFSPPQRSFQTVSCLAPFDGWSTGAPACEFKAAEGGFAPSSMPFDPKETVPLLPHSQLAERSVRVSH